MEKDGKIYLDQKYYLGNKKNTIEVRFSPITFASLKHTIDGVKTITHTPLEGEFYQMEILQCRHLGNSWNQGNEYFTSPEKAKEHFLKDDRMFELSDEDFIVIQNT